MPEHAKKLRAQNDVIEKTGVFILKNIPVFCCLKGNYEQLFYQLLTFVKP